MQQRMQPADVICWCQADGKLQPLRVRVMDEQEIYRRVDIESVLRRDEIHHTGAEAQFFICRGTIDGRTLQFTLKYLLRSHRWYVQGG